jgi:hypothetical protein
MMTDVRENDVEVVMHTTVEFPTQLPHANQRYFTGRIYNGVTLERLTKYEMRLEYFDRVLNAVVDADGRYVVGPLLANADYTIAVKAEGFRSFLSHNAKVAIAPSEAISSLYYDAFVYPDAVKAPAVRARFSLEGETRLPSGTVRFAPDSGSSLFDEREETPAGVGTQMWTNDEACNNARSSATLPTASSKSPRVTSYSVSILGLGLRRRELRHSEPLYVHRWCGCEPVVHALADQRDCARGGQHVHAGRRALVEW